MLKKYTAIAAFFGATGVILGAFGAHGLQQLTTDEKILHAFHTGVEYQLYHAIALLAVALLSDRLSGTYLRWAANCFTTGIILFSGSLYVIAWLNIEQAGSVRWIGPVTPVGGVFLIAGWVLLFVGAIRKGSL
jgi:uncharacterized membrane protein YgdD (TMEM256/DUF423 family)